MNVIMGELEMVQISEEMKAYKENPPVERSHYWHVERLAKRKKNGRKNWIFVRELWATKSEAAETFCKHFRDGDTTYRLRHMTAY